MVAVSAIGVVIIVLIVLLVSGGGSSNPPTARKSARTTTTHRAKSHTHTAAAGTSTAAAPLVSLSLRPSALVYVCLIGDGGRKLIPGLNLQPGESTPTYHARRYEITLGNSSVTMVINGRPRTVAPSSEAIGYTLTKARGRATLPASQRPTCK
jgi:hypothetical protein